MRSLRAYVPFLLDIDLAPMSFSEPFSLPPHQKPTGALKQRRVAKKRRNKQRRGQ
jgi:hypothetical protein